MFDNGSNANTTTFTLKLSFIFQDITFCGSQGAFGVISAMNGNTPVMYMNGKNDGVLKVKSTTKTSITLEMAEYSRVSFFSYWDFSVTTS